MLHNIIGQPDPSFGVQFLTISSIDLGGGGDQNIEESLSDMLDAGRSKMKWEIRLAMVAKVGDSVGGLCGCQCRQRSSLLQYQCNRHAH